MDVSKFYFIFKINNLKSDRVGGFKDGGRVMVHTYCYEDFRCRVVHSLCGRDLQRADRCLDG